MTRTLLAAVPRIALFLLASIPVLIGGLILRSMHLSEVDALTEPADILRRASYPWAITGHILGGAAILMLGLAQFSSRLRRAAPQLHRWTGRALVAGGTWIALSGLWMNAARQAQADSYLYNAAQNVMAVVLLAVLAAGIVTIRRGRVAAHRAWMMRAYAITLGSATQTIMILPVFLLFGRPEGLMVDLAFISGWVINLTVAEVIIRHRAKMPRLNASRA
jgi:uncharacterized membrane protein